MGLDGDTSSSCRTEDCGLHWYQKQGPYLGVQQQSLSVSQPFCKYVCNRSNSYQQLQTQALTYIHFVYLSQSSIF
ncbi:hypothetical protein J4Q44_G00118610 [Coregonus suidteri]|uniref:Uncharacterized protein n=1 Tax=Coregonus suidteri TaxID=861788 RepID=A0AAN8LUE4_9TELE